MEQIFELTVRETDVRNGTKAPTDILPMIEKGRRRKGNDRETEGRKRERVVI